MEDMYYSLKLSYFLKLTGSVVKYKVNGNFTQPVLECGKGKYEFSYNWFQTDIKDLENEIMGSVLYDLFSFTEGASFDIKCNLPLLEIIN